MDLKDHIKVLQEEKKRIDEPIANDLRNYARLLADIEQTNSNYNNDKKQLQEFEEFFSNFAKEEIFRADSIHVQKLENEIKMLKDKLAKLHAEIGDKKAYYETLRRNDSMSLAAMKTEESSLAAIERFYATSTEVSNTSKRTELVQRVYLTEKVETSLIINYLIYCESHGYPKTEDEREMYTNLLSCYMSKNSGALWKSIELVYQNYEVQKLLQRCVNEVAEFTALISIGDNIEQSFDTICANIKTGMKKVFPKIKGIRMAWKAEQVRIWYKRSFLKIDAMLLQWNAQNKTFQEEYNNLQKLESELRKGMQVGITKKDCQKYAQALDAIETARKAFLNINEISSAINTMSSEFSNYTSEVTELKNNVLRTKVQMRSNNDRR